MMQPQSSPEVTILFDATCQLCSREIEHYHRIDTAKRLAYVDISDPNFDAGVYGLDPQAVQRFMHVQLKGGEIITGVDAFMAIWRVVPRYQRLVPIAQAWGVRGILHVGYRAFAAIRPYLPKRARGRCALGACAVPTRNATL